MKAWKPELMQVFPEDDLNKRAEQLTQADFIRLYSLCQ